MIEDPVEEFRKEYDAELFREGLVLILFEENQDQDLPFEF